jgi:hypothetical protein
MIVSQTQVSMGVGREYVNNPRRLNGDKETVEGLITRICKYFENVSDPTIRIVLNEIKTQPLTLDRCQFLRILIDTQCKIVPDELNFQKDSNLILVAKLWTFGINKKQTITSINLDSESIEAAEISDLTQTQIVAVAQIASDSLDNYIKILQKSAQFSNHRMEHYLNPREREALIARPQRTKNCCTII